MTRGAALKPGDKLGSYELLVPVGAGGMGRVWAAREQSTTLKPRLVAIKTALAEEGATESFWKVLLDEARIASQVQHPNVCEIHEVERERGIVYLVMDWSDGGSLRELLDATPSHRIELPIAVRIVTRVCSGLHAVHELIGEDGFPLNVVHRDVSPQNVLLSSSGQVRITDFGVAKARGQLHAPTQTGEVKGKIAYMAPEQVTTKDVDRRADVFALGCVLYELTTGEKPFQGGDALATLYQLLEQPVTPPSARLPGYPPSLEAIVMKALERDPAARYPTAEELGRALSTWLVHEKLSVSDADVASVVRATLGQRIANRAREIEQAIVGIEHPPSLVPRPAPKKLEPDKAEGEAHAATLGGSSRPLGIRAPAPKSKRSLVIGLGAGALALVGVLGLARLFGPHEVPVVPSARTSAPVAPAVSVTPPPAGPEATVEITLRAEPEHAILFVDEGPALPNPYHVTVPPDGRVHRVRATAEGFVERVQEIVFDRPKEVVVALVALDRSNWTKEMDWALRERGSVRKPGQRPPAPAHSATPPGSLPTVVKKPIRPLDPENPFAPKP